MFFKTAINSFAPLKKDSLYDLSIELYASAKLKDEQQYCEILNMIQVALKSAPDNSFKAWMLGRVALAAVLVDDQENLKQTLPVLKNLLIKVNKDQYYAWALGYLAAVNVTEYETYRSDMIKAEADLPVLTDKLWSQVMNLQAAARAADKATFAEILERMKQITKQTTVTKALTEIPASDWQAWALSIVAEAAVTIDDLDLYYEISQLLSNVIIEAKKLYPVNGALAQINAMAASFIAASSKATLSSQ